MWKLVDSFKANRAKVGWVATFIAGGCEAVGYTDAARYIAILAGMLIGAGQFKSDQYHRERAQ